MAYKLYPRAKLAGRVALPPSKSEAIRAALLLRLSGGDPYEALRGYAGQMLCDDICHAIEAACALDRCPDAGESAALLRMTVCIQAALYGRVRVRAARRLWERGLWEAEECFHMPLDYSEGLVTGTAEVNADGRYEIDCSRTSQFLSGLLIALPLLPRECEIRVIKGSVSKPYSDMTADMVKRFGGDVEIARGGFITRSSCYEKPDELTIHGDESYAAVFRAVNLLGGRVEIEGSNEASFQPDKDFLKLAALCDCDISDHPDLAPLLAVTACGKTGETVLRGTARLKTKESDRESGAVRLITELGGSAENEGGRIMINGTGRLRGGVFDPRGDHRMCFAAAVASLICEEPVVILDTECVNKSAPGFWRDWKELLEGGME